MKRFIKFGICILLIVLTGCVVFMPQFISGQREKDKLSKTVYRNYNAGDRPRLTSEIVARLYYNREIDIGYNFGGAEKENEHSEIMRKTVMELTDMLFGKDETVCRHIESIISGGTFDYYRNSSLVKVDNKPTALNFITFCLKNGNTYFEIIFEEKTKTVIRSTFDFFTKEFADTENADDCFRTINSLLENYYENELNFTKEEYYIFDYNKKSDGFEAYKIIVFGLMQSPDKSVYGETEG